MDNQFFKNHIDYDLDLEESILGIFLIEPGCYGSVYGLVEAACFYHKPHKKVYEAIDAYWKSGGQIDLLTVARYMYDKGILEVDGCNTGFYLTKLTKNVVSSAHIKTWCLYVRELYAKRIMHQATHGGVKGEDIFQQASNIQSLINKALEIRNTDDWLTGDTVAQQLIESMAKAKENGGIGVSTGVSTIDDLNGGFKPGQMIVLGARPAVGKSAFFGRIALRNAIAGKKVGVISLEMPAKDVFARMVASETNTPFWQIDKNEIAEEGQRNCVYNGINTVSQMPIYFSETARVNIHDIRAKADKLTRRYGLDFLIIDYLQLIDSHLTGNKNRENEVSEISRGIKVMAMNLGIPVLALAQLNRNVESRKGKDRYPQLSDLRESGSLEQDADVVMFLHRDFASGVTEDESGRSTENDARLIVAKWRNGSPTAVDLHFQGDTMKFSEFSEIDKQISFQSNPHKVFQNRQPFKDSDEEAPY